MAQLVRIVVIVNMRQDIKKVLQSSKKGKLDRNEEEDKDKDRDRDNKNNSRDGDREEFIVESKEEKKEMLGYTLLFASCQNFGLVLLIIIGHKF